MSHKNPIKVKLKKEYIVYPEDAYEGKVIKSGNGAVIKSFKRFIGKDALVIIEDKMKDKIKFVSNGKVLKTKKLSKLKDGEVDFIKKSISMKENIPTDEITTEF